VGLAILLGIACISAFLIFGWPGSNPPKSPKEVAAENARTEAMARVRAEADAGKIAPDDVNEEMQFEGELAYNEALNADDARPKDQQLDEWSSALHYKVLELTRKPGLSCIEKVELEKPQKRPAIETIAEAIVQHECAGVTPIIVNFYLLDMDEDGIPWANAHFEPSAADPKPHFSVEISGKAPDQSASADDPPKKTGDEIIGKWRDPSNGFRSTIMRKNGRYYDEFSAKESDPPTRNSLEEASSLSGRKFVVTGSDIGEYYIIAPDGSLKVYSQNSYLKTVPKAAN
jgi:hypothetical protein